MTENTGVVSRRQFLNAAGAAVAAPMIVPSSVLGQRAGAVAPSDRIADRRHRDRQHAGTSSVNAILSYRDARFVAICDVRNERREVSQEHRSTSATRTTTA